MISKEERKKDKAVLAAATARPWIAVSPRSQRGGPQLASFGPAWRNPITHAVSLRVAGEMSLADAVTTQHAMTDEEHAANCRAAAHAVNRIEAYIADAEETERRIAVVRAHLTQEIARLTTAAEVAHRAGSVVDETADRDVMRALQEVLTVLDDKEAATAPKGS